MWINQLINARYITCATGSGCEHPWKISPEQWQEHSVSDVFFQYVSSSLHSCFSFCLSFYLPTFLYLFLSLTPSSSFLNIHLPSFLSYLSGSFYLFHSTRQTHFSQSEKERESERERNLPTGCYQPELTNHFPWSHSSRATPEGHCLSANADLLILGLFIFHQAVWRPAGYRGICHVTIFWVCLHRGRVSKRVCLFFVFFYLRGPWLSLCLCDSNRTGLFLWALPGLDNISPVHT